MLQIPSTRTVSISYTRNICPGLESRSKRPNTSRTHANANQGRTKNCCITLQVLADTEKAVSGTEEVVTDTEEAVADTEEAGVYMDDAEIYWNRIRRGCHRLYW